MLLTEEEAKKRWCPHAPADTSGMCLGSGCAAWRWAYPEPETPHRFERAWGNENAEEEPLRPDDLPADWVFVPCDDDYAGWREPDEQRDERHRGNLTRRRGYCGLAGKPDFD